MNDLMHDLQHLVELQQHSVAALTALSHYPFADQIPRAEYEAFFVAARAYLEAAVALDQRMSGVVDVPAAVNPLVQQLSICADVVEAQGSRDEASRLRAEADQLAATHLTGWALAGHRRTRAMEAAASGSFQEALIGLDAAQVAFIAVGDQVEAAQTLLLLANVVEWLGDFDRTREAVMRAEGLVAPLLTEGPPSPEAVVAAIAAQLQAIAKDGENDRHGEQLLRLRGVYHEILFARGRVHRWLGEWEAAASILDQLRPFYDELTPGVIDYLMATVALGKGELDRAEALLTLAEPHLSAGLARPRLGALRQVRADVAQVRGDALEALRQAEAGLADQDAYPDLDLRWKLHWRRGRALAALHRTEEALEAYRASAQAADTLRMRPLGYALDSTAVRDKLPMLHEAIDLAVTAGDGDTAVWFMELAKARALSALVSRPLDDAVPRAPGESADETRFDKLSTRIDRIAYAIYAKTATTAEVAEREELLQARRELLERIRIRDPRWRSITEPLPLDVSALRERLASRGRAALVLHLRGPKLIGALVGAEGVVLGQRMLSDSVVEQLTAFTDNLRRVKPDPSLFDLSGESDVGIDDLLTPEVAEALATAASSGVVLVVPHGILHLLPWGTMTLEGCRLVERTAVGVLPNLALLTDLDGPDDTQPSNGLPSAVLFGDPDTQALHKYPPLPQAGPELDALEQLYGPQGLVVPTTRGEAATQSALRSILVRDDVDDAVLHVACHADAYAADPISSGLILSDAAFDAADLIRTRCTFRQVVLSACSTGWRPQTAHGLELAGDDALGLVASFLEAGARALVVSVTQAKDDVARAFSVTWHRHRRAGATPLLATRAAQLELLAEDPAAVWAWSGFITYGAR